MLQMGFVDDIEFLFQQAPEEKQVALFTATLPHSIRRIAQTHMREPREISVQSRGEAAPKIRQRYWMVSGLHKLDALTRVLESEKFDAMLVFVRTKIETVDLAQRLEARGFAASALNGDMEQRQREQMVAQLKNGKIDILIATDVAARGLDVERISHVLNYDIPYDSETYVHRIGRTGRAGRQGDAILFVSPRERNMLRVIERVTKQQLEEMKMPSVADVNELRVVKFKEKITAAVLSGAGKEFQRCSSRSNPRATFPRSRSPPRSPAWCRARRRCSSRRSPSPNSRRRRRASTAACRRRPIASKWAMRTACCPATSSAPSPTKPASKASNIGHIDIREDHSYVDLPGAARRNDGQPAGRARARRSHSHPARGFEAGQAQVLRQVDAARIAWPKKTATAGRTPVAASAGKSPAHQRREAALHRRRQSLRQGRRAASVREPP